MKNKDILYYCLEESVRKRWYMQKEDIEVYTPELTQWKSFLYKGNLYQLIIRTDNYYKDNEVSYMELSVLECNQLPTKNIIWCKTGNRIDLHNFYFDILKGKLNKLIDKENKRL